MKLGFSSMIVVLGLLMALPAFAMDFHEARSAGIVGEKPDGYIAAVKKTSEAADIVEEVNEKRRQEYERISAENSQPVDIVAKIAAEKIINGLNPGEYYQDADGNWKSHE